MKLNIYFRKIIFYFLFKIWKYRCFKKTPYFICKNFERIKSNITIQKLKKLKRIADAREDITLHE